MDKLRDLYQQVILDHHDSPRHFREVGDADREVEGDNPLCGDHLHVYVTFSEDEQQVEDVSFQGKGCAISRASASLMSQITSDKSTDEVLDLIDSFVSVVTSETNEEPETEGLGKLKVLAGVREYPVRVKCATLAWHTLKSALQKDQDVVTTE